MGFRFDGANFSVIAIDNTSGPSPMPVRNGSIGGTAAAMFPQFAVGGGWASQLMLLNRTPGVISGRVDVFDPAGNPKSVTLNNVTSSTFRYSIPAGGTLLLAPRDLNGQSALYLFRILLRRAVPVPTALLPCQPPFGPNCPP